MDMQGSKMMSHKREKDPRVPILHEHSGTHSVSDLDEKLILRC